MEKPSTFGVPLGVEVFTMIAVAVGLLVLLVLVLILICCCRACKNCCKKRWEEDFSNQVKIKTKSRKSKRRKATMTEESDDDS